MSGSAPRRCSGTCRRRRCLVLLLALALLPWSAPVGAAQATPTAAPPGCDLPPRSPEEIARLLATPTPPEPNVDQSGGPPMPMGEPLRPEEQIRIEQTVHLFIACYNAGEPLRIYRLYTDRYLQGLISGERSDVLAAPMPAGPGRGAELVKITGGRRIPDIEGRLGALVTIRFPAAPQPQTFFFIFLPVDNGDRLLIDDVLGVLAVART